MNKTALIAVAYSAGRDSTALLHATWRAAQAQGGLEVLALHVHHGLSAHADDWLGHAQQQCSTWAQDGAPLRFQFERLSTRPARGESIEAWARKARYRALADMAHRAGAAVVLLAHHRQDQAETFLLQALRGAGVAGLAAMPAQVQRGGILWCRPWLQQPREAIEHYVRLHRLAYVDDDSNSDSRFARNRLRQEVWPALLQSFPQAQETLSDAATWAAQAHELLQEQAQHDLALLGASDASLPLAVWATLSLPRRSNALRSWVLAASGQAASSTLVQRLLLELPGVPKKGRASWPHASGSLRQYRGRLTWQADVASVATQSQPPPETQLRVRRAGVYRLPGWGGQLRVQRVAQGGVPMAWLGELALLPRTGGEQFQAGLGRPPRSLKKQFQAAAVPEWERGGPLVYSGGQLVFVPGLGLDARVLALPGQPQAMLFWER
ncbi:MAG: tRNA lysidine(34) synthetase TilS [Burkholderiales bacterium]